MDFDYSLSPIDIKSALITDQRNTSPSVLLDKKGLVELLGGIGKRREKIKKQLGCFNGKRSLRNKMYAFNKNNRCSFGFKSDRDLFLELVALGVNQQNIIEELKRMKQERREKHYLRNKETM